MNNENRCNEYYIMLEDKNISRDYIESNGKESLLILAILYRNITTRSHIVYNFKTLFDVLNIQLNRKTQKDAVINSMRKMFGNEIPSNINIDEIYNISYNSPNKDYTIIKDNDVNKIINYNRRVDKYNLFNTYAILNNHLKTNEDISNLTLKKLRHEIMVAGSTTIPKYLSILSNLNIIKTDKYNDINKYISDSSNISKSDISLEGLDCKDMRGIYFIYDKNNLLAYIGKSTACVVDRAINSVNERKLYDFTKIEIKPTQSQSDVDIYEKYYIQKYKPYCNIEGVYNDRSNIILPDIETKQVLRNVSLYQSFHK